MSVMILISFMCFWPLLIVLYVIDKIKDNYKARKARNKKIVEDAAKAELLRIQEIYRRAY